MNGWEISDDDLTSPNGHEMKGLFMSEFETIVILTVLVFGIIFEICLSSIAFDINAIKKEITKRNKNP